MSATVLTSKNNPLVRTIRLVAEQARRAPSGLVLAEGLRVLEEATAAGCRIEAVLVTEAFGGEARERSLLRTWSDRGVRVQFATAAVMDRLSDVVSPQGVLALVHVPELTLAEAPQPQNPLILCLCGMQDPGNLGTLLRTARAAGVSFVCCTSGTVSARNSKSIRASAGAFFCIPVIEKLVAAEFLQYCRNGHIRVCKADAHSGTSCWSTDLASSTAILLGNEARGFSRQEWDEVPSVRIPLSAGVESLNVAAAGAVLVFEAYRQRSERNREKAKHE